MEILWTSDPLKAYFEGTLILNLLITCKFIFRLTLLPSMTASSRHEKKCAQAVHDANLASWTVWAHFFRDVNLTSRR
jgi:hypothetical protein